MTSPPLEGEGLGVGGWGLGGGGWGLGVGGWGVKGQRDLRVRAIRAVCRVGPVAGFRRIIARGIVVGGIVVGGVGAIYRNRGRCRRLRV